MANDPEKTTSDEPKMLTGEHEVKIGGVIVLKVGERVSKDELVDRATQAAVAFFAKQPR